MDDFETDFDFENFDIEAFAREAIGDIQPIESAMTQPQSDYHNSPTPAALPPPAAPPSTLPPSHKEKSIWDIPSDSDGETSRPPLPVQHPTQPAAYIRKQRSKRNRQAYYEGLGGDPSKWWYKTEAQFNAMSEAQRRRWCHIGALLFTKFGTIAQERCQRCKNAGRECVVYTKAAKDEFGPKTPKVCAYCMPNNSTCDAVPPAANCRNCSKKNQVIADLEKKVEALRLENNSLRQALAVKP